MFCIAAADKMMKERFINIKKIEIPLENIIFKYYLKNVVGIITLIILIKFRLGLFLNKQFVDLILNLETFYPKKKLIMNKFTLENVKL